MGLLQRAHSYKDKMAKGELINLGLFYYPMLMTSDILIYDAKVVPVGKDQKQHVELARDIAKRFNHQFGETFVVPQAVTKKEGARIMSLLDPSKKMSKSDINQNNAIALLDNIEDAKKKIIRAVTDSGTEVAYDLDNKPAISNLLTIFTQLGNREIPRLVKDLNGVGYGDFKVRLAEVVGNFLEDFQEKYIKISDEEVFTILEDGQKRAEKIAEKKLNEVKKIIGIK
jgi:tryptophanyl-tRNA synthetase